ncbi:MAG: carbonic anhydrase [Bacteroidia bacterium]|nr:MAG: carbonic anhydrase [Bacteroidia bacterium]
MQVLSEFSSEQKPFAFILSCIDSRSPVEIIFDQGIGDLFSARVAGNIINEDILASAEFAVNIVGAKLIMILGHTKCGAMGACLNQTKDGYLKKLIEKIEPTYLKYKNEVDSNAQPQDKLSEYNVLESMQILIDKSDILRQALRDKKIIIAGSIFHLDSGKVEVLRVLDKL